MNNILKEINSMFKLQNKSNLDLFIRNFKEIIDDSDIIVGIGAGRMGYSLKAFIMRLSHMGYKSFMLGDTGLPKITSKSVVIFNSSSGKTESNLLMSKIAKKNKSKIISFCCNNRSKLVKSSKYFLKIPIIKSNQPLKSIYEQYTYLLFDFIIFKLINNNTKIIKKMESTHSILE